MKAYLAKGEKLLVVFLVMLGSLVCSQCWRKKRGKRLKKTNRNKNRGAGLSPTLAYDFLFFNAQNPPLFIRGGKGKFYFYRGQILAFDSTGKDPNQQLKGTIMKCENQLLKAGGVGHFGVTPWWQQGSWPARPQWVQYALSG